MGAINLKMLLESQSLERAPFPVPVGWYFIDYSENLKPGELRNIFVFGQEWVLFRSESGKPGVTDPYCPHLGAHMGHGGKVCGEHLRCPFHHWEYDTEGNCKVIPYAKVMPPITKKGPILRALPTIEKYGMIWSWYHPACEAPSFELPYVPEIEDATGYTGHRRGSWSANTCIQEIAENGVDVAHLKFLHNAPIIPPVEATYNGPTMRINIGQGYIVGDSYGPGLNVMRFTQKDPTTGKAITATMLSYTVPVSHDKSQMNMSFRHIDFPAGSPELAFTKKQIDHMIGAAEGEESAGFESVDFIVWNNKRYRPNPLLCDGDGPIFPFRKWFKQFYVEKPNLDDASA
ncbi:MAG: FeS-binding protein [Nevskiaceae bacterium]|nr:MAG: FeS-binding protein [Nevskiaceae bacterium]TAM25243.1 MAG: FeS-binding protein [Nevskiaceae bacterium]